MLDLVKKFFGGGAKEDLPERGKGDAHDIRVAACALLLEMAHVDGKISKPERENIVSVMKKNYGLSNETAAELMESAEEKLEGSIDLWQFTNLINLNYSLDEKFRIIELIWEIAYTDGRLDKHEDYLVHKLAALLRLSHNQLIEAKLKAKTTADR
ncbi:MAG: TerB family tellurite resistance protein [Deltaproteobacteria bacterium]|nr:TerB family tellurite resistance protein [Deltaproteobacteria bacterium]